MTKRIEILIVVAILIGLAFVFGCKDEVEASDCDWPKMNYVCSGYGQVDNPIGSRCKFVSPPNIKDNIGRSWFYCQEHYNQSEWIRKGRIERDVFLKISEPNEPKTYTAEELDEIYIDEPALGNLAKALYGYNEVTAMPNEPSELELHCACGLTYKITGYDLNYKTSVSLVTDIPEPNEKIYFKEK